MRPGIVLELDRDRRGTAALVPRGARGEIRTPTSLRTYGSEPYAYANSSHVRIDEDRRSTLAMPAGFLLKEAEVLA